MFTLKKMLFQTTQSVPSEYQSNFIHLYLDIAWFGVLNGSVISFISVYAARLGATPEQLGLITAVPAIVNLIFSLPSGKWLDSRPIGKSIFWSSVLMRIFYLLLIPLPWFFVNHTQIWVIVLITLCMSIPGVILGVGFNALFAEAVPPVWRGQVAGIRNAFFAITNIVVMLISGQILTSMPFPAGYQIVFGIGCVGAALSSFHLWFVKSINQEPKLLVAASPASEIQEKRSLRIDRNLIKKYLIPQSATLRLDILTSEYGKVLILLFVYHLFHNLPGPIFTIYTVNELGFSDQIISYGSAIFYFLFFLASLKFEKLSRKWGNQKIVALGIMLISLYPYLLVISYQPWLFLVTSGIGGVAWAMISGGLVNYLLEKVPSNDRPVYFAWYFIFFNAAILLGSIGGPIIAGWVGLPIALIIFATGRLLSGLSIFRWG